MKRILLSLAAAGLASTAYAADPIIYEPSPSPLPVLDAPGFSWTGGYVGVNAGYVTGKMRVRSEITADTLVDRFGLGVDGDGFAAGVQAGFNWQEGSIIYGLETDLQWTNYKGTSNASGFFNAMVQTDDLFTGRMTSEIDWFGSTRARIGFTPSERLMVYATGGVAYGKVKASLTADTEMFDGVPYRESKSSTRVGWTAGVGGEYAFNDSWSLKTEYLYTDLGKMKLYDGEVSMGDEPLFGMTNIDADARFRFHTIRLGLNYRF